MSVHSSVSRCSIPRFVLSAAASGSGKTTLAIGLIAALLRRGLTVSAAKAGPDFIDTAHLTRASGRPARNLDPWLSSEAFTRRSFARGAADADVCVVEGVMGLFDGRHGSGDGSTAHVAQLLGAPVILVLDCARASSTIGAIAFGLARFDPRVRVAGAILNRVASERHAATVRDAVNAAGVPVLGIVHRDERVELAQRHLGLVEPGSDWSQTLSHLADAMERSVDLDAVLAVARSAESFIDEEAPSHVVRDGDVRVAVARDEAFWFYEEGSLEALRDAGAHLVEYSPLRDPFPHVHAAFIGGGYPELYAPALSSNHAAREGLHRAMEAGLPVYAECGGLLYLGDAIVTDGAEHAMVGAVPVTSTMEARRVALRYVEAQSVADGPMFARGSTVRGHEFHYARAQYKHDAPVYAIEDEREGFADGAAHASFVHVHLGAYPSAVEHFLGRARAFAGIR